MIAWFLRKHIGQFERDLQSLREEFELLRAEGLPSPPPNGFNLNRRPDILRRLRRGQQMDNIAAATGWSLPEIELLKKVQEPRS